MYWDGSWDASEFTERRTPRTRSTWRPLPEGSEKQASSSTGSANVISAKTKHADAAWKFVEVPRLKERGRRR